MIQGQPLPLLPTPIKNDEHQKQSPFPRRPNRFEERDDVIQTQDNNGNYSGYRGGRNNYNDRANSSAISRGSNRGRGGSQFKKTISSYDCSCFLGGGGNTTGRGYFNSNDRQARSDSNDNNTGGFRSRSGFNRGGKFDEIVFGSIDFNCSVGRGGNNGSQSRFFPRGNIRGNSHDHSSSHRSSRSPDRRSSSHRNDHNTDKYSSTTSGFSAPSSEEFSHRQLPLEALRKKEQSNFDPSSNNSNNNLNKSSLVIDETIGNRTGHSD